MFGGLITTALCRRSMRYAHSSCMSNFRALDMLHLTPWSMDPLTKYAPASCVAGPINPSITYT